MEDLLHPDRFFSPEPVQRETARRLYERVKALPLICPHGHVDPGMFADPEFRFGSPAELLLVPDHYIYRMLYSQGVQLEDLGVGQKEYDRRLAWQLFAERFYLFAGTPTGIWLRDELANVFGVEEILDGKNAQAVYDQIDAKLRTPQFSPRALFEQFNIEVLCTTDAAADSLDQHAAIRKSGWTGRVLPTFRPDGVVNLAAPDWKEQIHALEGASGIAISDLRSFVDALEDRRAFFKSMGAAAADHAALTAKTLDLSEAEIDAVFQRGLRGEASAQDAEVFTAGMLVEFARMSAEDGLVMQLHIGSYRNHNPAIYQQFGPDKGADIPVASEFTRSLKPLLDRYGTHPNLTLILFTLDESTYARELAPLAGHYPAIKIGPPWWFHDSINGMKRFFDRVIETAGIYNTVGFNDDTRAFPSIPARHDVWRRVVCDWAAGLVVRHMIDRSDAEVIVEALSYSLAKQTYKL